MPKVDVGWASALSRPNFQRVIALGVYRQQALLLQIEFEAVMRKIEEQRKQSDKESLWLLFGGPWFRMWTGMTYVVYEGILDLGIDDEPLRRIVDRGDIAKLRRFRNGAFHVQGRFLPHKMTEHVQAQGLEWTHELWHRMDFLVRKMLRLATRHSQHRDGPP